MSAGSFIANYSKLVTPNNGDHNNLTNKCGVISIGNSMGIDSSNYIDLIIDVLQMSNNEMLDFNRKRSELQNICDLLGVSISVHCAKKMDNDIIRVWRTTQIQINPKDLKYQDIHLLWYGGHFEYVDWAKINDYPEFNDSVYKLVERNGNNTAENVLYQYNIIYSTLN